ncbi:hypothetical protein K469DRAFT_359701 [Zopfia rhizophila CBS 207.26]|uniref:Protein kinase domain-containing protein n=1 Tax=Zopfia rhizophila CBS 207.26 TaxID=1314779 RepID=A0A6A6ELZ6_9PEZI|nr:hypothetical protein K469DRAFT_359701 [Zopfia rhizophila CBS 207.26]
MADPGTMLSVVSLTFQVFSGCIQGYQLIADAQHMPSDCQYLRVRLKTEQYRLLDWAHVVQLDEQDDNLLISNSSKGLLLDVLDQQRKLLAQFGRLDDKYKKLTRPLLVDEVETNGVLPDPPAYSPTETSPTIKRVDSDFHNRFPQSEALLKKSLDWARKSKTYPRRLKWAIFDKTKMETLVLKLTSFNDFMREMLNATQLQTLAVKQTRTEFQIMQLNSSVGQLVQIFESAALTMKTQKRGGRFPTNPVHAFLQARGLEDEEENDLPKPGMQNLATLAQIKALNSAIEDPNLFTDEFTTSMKLAHTASEIRSVELCRRDITLLDEESEDGESQRVEAFYQPPKSRKTSVWIEWKTYEPPTFQNSGPDPKIHQRVKALTTLLKENNRTDQFRAPHCLGYFRDIDEESGEDHCRFGLVFEKPASAHPSTRPISLHSLLTEVSETPSLTERIQLATRLSETIERLHAVNWLHKGLRSANILFFSDCGIDGIDFNLPYISGFDYSRPAMNDDMTEKPPENAASDIYRHPRVQGSGNRDSIGGVGGFKKSHDLYALGVILLEIAYWKPIDKILGIEDLNNARPSVTIKVRQRLLDEKEGFLRFVRSYLGNTVEGVVRTCLRGPESFGLSEGADEKSEDIGAELQKMFYERVVRELGDMRV